MVKTNLEVMLEGGMVDAKRRSQKNMMEREI